MQQSITVRRLINAAGRGRAGGRAGRQGAHRTPTASAKPLRSGAVVQSLHGWQGAHTVTSNAGAAQASQPTPQQLVLRGCAAIQLDLACSWQHQCAHQIQSLQVAQGWSANCRMNSQVGTEVSQESSVQTCRSPVSARAQRWQSCIYFPNVSIAAGGGQCSGRPGGRCSARGHNGACRANQSRAWQR